MQNVDIVRVIDQDGVRGSVDRQALLHTNDERVLVRFDNGQTALVEKRLLEAQPDGSYRLNVSIGIHNQVSSYDANAVIVPVIEEEIEVGKRVVERGKVRIAKTVSEREVLVDQPLMHEHVEVNRVPVNRMVDQAPAIRYEGDTMIVPVLEEVVVVEVRLMLREEVHVVRRREETHEPQRVVVRREDVSVEALHDPNTSTLTTDLPE